MRSEHTGGIGLDGAAGTVHGRDTGSAHQVRNIVGPNARAGHDFDPVSCLGDKLTDDFTACEGITRTAGGQYAAEPELDGSLQRGGEVRDQIKCPVQNDKQSRSVRNQPLENLFIQLVLLTAGPNDHAGQSHRTGLIDVTTHDVDIAPSIDKIARSGSNQHKAWNSCRRCGGHQAG